METATGQAILQTAQEKLLFMRKERKATESPGLNQLSTDLNESIERCQKRQRELRACGVIMFREGEELKQSPISILSCRGVDKKYQECRFDNFRGGSHLGRDLKRLISEGKSIVLSGNTGCGKTHLAAAMMAEYLKHQNTTEEFFITIPDLLLEIRTSFSEKSETTEKEIVERFAAYQLLVLDDLGAEKPTEHTVATLSLILDRRIRQERQTIITTNLSLDAVAEYSNARIASRISGMECIAINMPDYRKKRGATC